MQIKGAIFLAIFLIALLFTLALSAPKKKSANYLLSASVLSYMSSLLTGYLVMEAIDFDGRYADSTGIWLAVIVGGCLSYNSYFEKRALLVKFNWLVILLFQLLIISVGYILDSHSVIEALRWYMVFSIYTFGIPILVVFVSFIWHLLACAVED